MRNVKKLKSSCLGILVNMAPECSRPSEMHVLDKCEKVFSRYLERAWKGKK